MNDIQYLETEQEKKAFVNYRATKTASVLFVPTKTHTDTHTQTHDN